MFGAKPFSASCVLGAKLSTYIGDSLPDPIVYHQVVGVIQYCTLTRPDIAYFVNQLCQHLHSSLLFIGQLLNESFAIQKVHHIMVSHSPKVAIGCMPFVTQTWLATWMTTYP